MGLPDAFGHVRIRPRPQIHIISNAEHTRGENTVGNNYVVRTAHFHFLLMFLVYNVLQVCRSRELYEEPEYYLLSNDTFSRSMGRFFAMSPQ